MYIYFLYIIYFVGLAKQFLVVLMTGIRKEGYFTTVFAERVFEFMLNQWVVTTNQFNEFSVYTVAI